MGKEGLEDLLSSLTILRQLFVEKEGNHAESSVDTAVVCYALRKGAVEKDGRNVFNPKKKASKQIRKWLQIVFVQFYHMLSEKMKPFYIVRQDGFHISYILRLRDTLPHKSKVSTSKGD